MITGVTGGIGLSILEEIIRLRQNEKSISRLDIILPTRQSSNDVLELPRWQTITECCPSANVHLHFASGHFPNIVTDVQKTLQDIGSGRVIEGIIHCAGKNHKKAVTLADTTDDEIDEILAANMVHFTKILRMFLRQFDRKEESEARGLLACEQHQQQAANQKVEENGSTFATTGTVTAATSITPSSSSSSTAPPSAVCSKVILNRTKAWFLDINSMATIGMNGSYLAVYTGSKCYNSSLLESVAAHTRDDVLFLTIRAGFVQSSMIEDYSPHIAQQTVTAETFADFLLNRSQLKMGPDGDSSCRTHLELQPMDIHLQAAHYMDRLKCEASKRAFLHWYFVE
jgi:NAD(P)-dependent dehydrogenase (short-subunit alcohol dehydrogenase family)